MLNKNKKAYLTLKTKKTSFSFEKSYIQLMVIHIKLFLNFYIKDLIMIF
jgi:hypothetical protein